MIVGVAGHIDHGKTSLVKALTGVDTDRLREEKARGISIDLGFAYKRLASGTSLAFVDMPGHEKFIRNMVAGACGIDCAILAIAANEGVKPQTLEHLLALELLELKCGIAVITKADLASQDRLAAVSSEVAQLLHRRGMGSFPVLPVSVREQRGLDVLQDRLGLEGQRCRPVPRGGRFRLAIDRFFKLDGHGPVVTGAVWAGEVRVGDRLTISPSGITVRVRRIHADGEPTEIGRAGERCALNVVGAGLTQDVAARGNWAVDPALHLPTTEMDVRLHLASSAERSLVHWSQMQLHLGTDSAEVRVALVDCSTVEPGSQALARLVTCHPMLALHGDRFLIRDPSSRRIVGGGTVLDPFAPPARRRKAERASVLRTMEAGSPADQLAGLLREIASGIDLSWFSLTHNLDAAAASALMSDVPSVRIPAGAIEWGFDENHFAVLCQNAADAVASFLRSDKVRKGMPETQLRQRLGMSEPGFTALVGRLVSDGRLTRVEGLFSVPGHSPDLTRTDEAVLRYLSDAEAAASFALISVAGLAAGLQISEKESGETIKRLSQLGRLVFVDRNLVMLPGALGVLARVVEQTAARSDERVLTLTGFRAASGLGRNHAVILLEYFDRQRFTLRSGAGRRVLREAVLAFPHGVAEKSA